jgi:formylglycine-generating enzyme required for sulfatase activity
MNRIWAYIIPFTVFSPAFSQDKIQPYVKKVVQDIPAIYQSRYYFQNRDTFKSCILPTKKVGALCKGFVPIAGREFQLEKQDGYDTIINITKSYKTAPFYLYKTEITNAEYRLFIQEAKERALYPDTNCWENTDLGENPMRHYYFQHEAYQTYPVVGVSHWQAKQYCEWLKKKIESKLSENGIQNLLVEVDLPTESEWQAAWIATNRNWIESQNLKTNRSNTKGRSYLDFVYGPNGYRCNFGPIQTPRLSDIKKGTTETGENFFQTPSISYESANGVYNLLGNVAEWTNTSAKLSLYNRKQYIYTMSENLIVNTQETIDSVKLATYLHTDEQLESHFAIKGGSWHQELYYLQPAAMHYLFEGLASSYVGFRPVIRFYKKK